MDEQRQPPTASTVEHQPEPSLMGNILPPIKPRRFGRAFAKLLLIIIVAAVIIFGTIWFFSRPKTATAPAAATKSATPASSTTTTKMASSIKHYDSSNYNLGLDYPTGWTVADEATAKLTVTSSAVQLKGSDGQTFAGQIVLTIQNQQTSIAAFAKNEAVAALESQKITYTKPTSNQRAQTYVSFVNYSGDASGIDALYITGDNGYQVAQSVPQADVVQANPLVSVSFLKCATTACTGAGTAATIASNAWANTMLSKPILSLLMSLSFQ